MPALIPIAAAVVGGVIASSGSKSAAKTQANAANQATATQQGMFNTTNAQQAPWRNAGQTALNQMTAGTAPGGQFSHSFNASDLNSNLAPNYQFQLDQGLGAVNNQNSVTSGLVSGNALKGINDYAQGYAGNAYQNAFNNYNTNQSNIFNRLSSIAGLGQTSVGQTTNAALDAPAANCVDPIFPAYPRPAFVVCPTDVCPNPAILDSLLNIFDWLVL